jgi:hypothetical protein
MRFFDPTQTQNKQVPNCGKLWMLHLRMGLREGNNMCKLR